MSKEGREEVGRIRKCKGKGRKRGKERREMKGTKGNEER